MQGLAWILWRAKKPARSGKLCLPILCGEPLSPLYMFGDTQVSDITHYYHTLSFLLLTLLHNINLEAAPCIDDAVTLHSLSSHIHSANLPKISITKSRVLFSQHGRLIETGWKTLKVKTEAKYSSFGKFSYDKGDVTEWSKVHCEMQKCPLNMQNRLNKSNSNRHKNRDWLKKSWITWNSRKTQKHRRKYQKLMQNRNSRFLQILFLFCILYRWICLFHFCEPWLLFLVIAAMLFARASYSEKHCPYLIIFYTHPSLFHWDWVTLASTLSYSPECQKDPLASILLGWAGTVDFPFLQNTSHRISQSQKGY